VFLGSNEPYVEISGNVTNGKRLLLIKDSYANSFVQFLVDDYEEIVAIDLRYYHLSAKKVIEEKGITDCLFLYNVENFSIDENLVFLKL
jgi:hypothetical protein